MDLNFLGSIIELGLLGLLFGAFLGFAAKKFAVEVDERVEKIEAILPGANCGACGLAGCSGFARDVVAGKAAVNACIPGGASVSAAICALLGTEASVAVKTIAARKCRGGSLRAKDKFQYDGIRDCRAAVLVADGPKLCPNGCIGFGTCAAVCPFDAITMGEDSLPNISPDKCTGCGACVTACPKHILELISTKSQVWIACNNILPGKFVKEACETGCIACKLCQKNCPADAIIIENNLARIDYTKCTNCQICVVVCPTSTIHTSKSGEILNDAPKVRAAFERKKAKEQAEA